MVLSVASRLGCVDVMDVHNDVVRAFLREVIAMPVEKINDFPDYG